MCVSKLLVLTTFFYRKLSSEVAHVCFTCDMFLILGGYEICIASHTDYGRPEGKEPSLHGRKFNPNPKFLGMAAAYFVCHIGPFFQISLIHSLGFVVRDFRYLDT